MTLVIGVILVLCAASHISDGQEDWSNDQVQQLIDRQRSFLEQFGTQPAVEDYGNLTLHQAVEQGNLNAVKHLIETGSNINVQYIKDTPLTLAIKKGHIDIMNYLLDKRVKINQKVEFMERVSGVDYDNYYRSREVKVRLAPLHVAILQKKFDIAKLLIDRKAYINVKDNIGATALIYAIDYKNTDMLTYLIKNGADINIQMHDGNTALHKAVSKHYIEGVKFLLQNGADTSIENGLGETALHVATSKEDIEAVTILLENRAETFIKNKHGETSLALAMKARNPDIVELILSNDAANNKSDDTVIYQLVQGLTGYDEDDTVVMLEVILKYQNNTLENSYNDGSDITKTSLISAVIQNKLEVMKLLLKSGAKVNAVATGSQSTALHMAATHQNVEAFKLLLKYGASVKVKDDYGRTPLDHLIPEIRDKITKLYPEFADI